jgi:hypothetical protein
LASSIAGSPQRLGLLRLDRMGRPGAVTTPLI